MLKTFIERPVLSTVISILIVVLGIIGLLTLPIEQYPDIAPPTVQISTQYTGASAAAVQNSVVIPIEEAVNGVEGMTYMNSNAQNGGGCFITVYFERGTDPDQAAVRVQNLVSSATALLPQEVTRAGVTVRKRQNSNILGIGVYSDSDDYDGLFIQNFVNINILPQIKRVNGVGEASVMGAKDFSMRVWLKPDVMASYRIAPAEVLAALADQNIEAAPGELGAQSNQAFQYNLTFTGKLKTEEEFKNIIVRSQNGQILRLSDIADVELGAIMYSIQSTMDGKENVMIQINQTAGSNASEVIENIKKVMKESESMFPEGIHYKYIQDASEFLNASIAKVVETLLEAFLLVFIVVFVFLQNFRATIIPGIAVPVAIIGTFFFLQIFGFSINLLTLFALVLAIGIVVDDAIVVVEAVQAKIEHGERDPKKASIDAMKEIAPAIVSITLVMASVFIPVSFIGGTSGVFYRQFGLTLAIAILISAVNALTLSPALSALFLRPIDGSGKKRNIFKRMGDGFNHFFAAATNKYKSGLHFLGKRGHRWITVAIIIVALALLAGLMKIIPTGFVPNEDSGGVVAMVTLPPGSSLERSDSIAEQLVAIAGEIEEVDIRAKITGLNFMAGGLGSSYAMVMIKLTNWDKREKTSDDIVAELREKTKNIRNAELFFAASPTLQGFGMSSGVDLKLQDRQNRDIFEFYDVSQKFVEAMRKRPEVLMALNNFNPNFTQLQIEADIPKIKAAGLTLSTVMTTLQAYIGSMYVSNFNMYGKQFRLMVQASPEFRSKPADLNGMFVQTATGEMAPVTEFLTLTEIKGPQSLSRFNMYSNINITLIPNMLQGKSTGDVEKAVQEVAEQMLFPNGYSFEYAGLAREEANSGNQTILIFGLCLIFIYLLLAALYESYILPLAVIFSLPIGLSGVFLFVGVGALAFNTGIVNNIYVQISLIMLIGLLSKNAILIVEYAIQRRQQGMSVVEAAVNGAVARLRPILMTSFAFIVGLLPLALATGAGAIGNRSIGISAIGGMLVGTFIGVLVIPSLFIIFQTMQEKFSKSGLVNSNEEVINPQNK